MPGTNPERMGIERDIDRFLLAAGIADSTRRAYGADLREFAGWYGDYGNMVVLTHGFGLSTRYGHLSRFAVVAGMDVKRGAVIGYVGATGRATGSHVHYEVLVNGTPIDPLQILTGAIRS